MKAYRTVLISAVVYSVLIGSIYVTLSVLAILTRNCWFDMSGSPLIYMIYLLYFRVYDCKITYDWSALGIAQGQTPDIPDETQAVHRTFIFAVVYFGLYCALIVTALVSVSGINNSCLGRRSFPIFFAPWIFVCCAILVMDILATTYYITDSIATASTDGLMELLGIKNPEIIGSVLEQLAPQWRFLPPIIMFLATSKCFIFLIFDIVIITLIIKAGWAASTYHKYVEDTVRQYSQNMSRANPAFENSQTDIVAQKQHAKQIDNMNDDSPSIQETPVRTVAAAEPETPDRYNDTSVQAFIYPERVTYVKNDNREQEEKQNSIPRPSTLALSSKLNERQQPQQQQQQQQQQPQRQQLQLQPQQQNRNGQIDQRELESRLSHYTASNGNVIRSVEPLKDENISEKQQQQSRVRVLPMVAEINRNSSEIRQRPVVPPKPQNNNRLSKQPSLVDERPDSRNSGVNRTSSANGELRSQLPWSYFKARDDVPKKSFREVEEYEDLPPVPIPDYTLHFPKAKRSNLNSDSDGDGSWNNRNERNDQRY